MFLVFLLEKIKDINFKKNSINKRISFLYFMNIIKRNKVIIEINRKSSENITKSFFIILYK